MNEQPSRHRAFSLLEMVMALAIAGVITAAATTATMSIYDASLTMTQSSFAHEEAKIIADLVSTNVLQVGGGRVRPWNAISNGCFIGESGALTAVNGGVCNEQGGTRLDIVDFVEGTEQLTLQDLNASRATFSLGGQPCPLTAAKGFPSTGVNVVFITNTEGGGFRGARCTPRVVAPSTCECTLTPLGGVGAVAVPHVRSTAPVFTGGTMLVGQIVSFERDGTSLFERRDFDEDGNVERRLISDRIFDFRVLFGHDAQPEDGEIDTLSGGWQTPLDIRPTAAQPATALRMARIGVIVGGRLTKPNATTSTASLFGNAPLNAPRFSLRAAETAVTLRNLLVFF